jgi:DNA-binding NarL/FixJ family response regulator
MVTLMDIQMPEMNGLDALIAIRTGFSDAWSAHLADWSDCVPDSRASGTLDTHVGDPVARQGSVSRLMTRRLRPRSLETAEFD